MERGDRILRGGEPRHQGRHGDRALGRAAAAAGDGADHRRPAGRLDARQQRRGAVSGGRRAGAARRVFRRLRRRARLRRRGRRLAGRQGLLLPRRPVVGLAGHRRDPGALLPQGPDGRGWARPEPAAADLGRADRRGGEDHRVDRHLRLGGADEPRLLHHPQLHEHLPLPRRAHARRRGQVRLRHAGVPPGARDLHQRLRQGRHPPRCAEHAGDRVPPRLPRRQLRDDHRLAEHRQGHREREAGLGRYRRDRDGAGRTRRAAPASSAAGR